MKKIFVCSPLLGDIPENSSETKIRRTIEGNQAWAEMYCWYVFHMGHRPFAPHLLYPRFLDDANPEHRELGIKMGLLDLEECEEVWVFLKPWQKPSRGMQREIARAEELGKKIVYVDSFAAETAYAEAYKTGAVSFIK